MRSENRFKELSRRDALLALAFGLGASLTASSASAQETGGAAGTPDAAGTSGAAGAAGTPESAGGGGTAGMKRRQQRRSHRHERRKERREGRHERRKQRRTGAPSTSPTPPAQ